MGELEFDPGIPIACFDLAALTYQDVKAFVETGTCAGASVGKALGYFDEVWSCETNAELAAKTQNGFCRFPHVHIEHEDSRTFLPRVLGDISSRGLRALVWLDAHYSGDVFAHGTAGEHDCPLLSELDAVADIAANPPVVAIDDMADMNGTNLPTVHDICRRLHLRSRHRYAFQAMPELRRGVLMCLPPR